MSELGDVSSASASLLLLPPPCRPPFTIQRLCELLSDPRKSYTSTKKLTYAFERVRYVVPLILYRPSVVWSIATYDI